MSNRLGTIAVIIPAFEPGQALLSLVASLTEGGFAGIIIIDDGSGPQYQPCFDNVGRLAGVKVLQHAVNLGKGAALKTGINYVLCAVPGCIGVVTADADGQHAPEDIVRVAERLRQKPDTLVLGVRQFGHGIPWRSRIGNSLTRVLVRFLLGQRLSDTQTGLRGIPRLLLPHLLPIASSGYDFELDMLITSKHRSCPVVEQNIQTIYEDGNKSSHFNPVLDSMRIYFVLLRFTLLSMMTAIVDNLVFFAAFLSTANILESQLLGRLVAVCFNYLAVRKTVFLSGERHQTALPKYLSLVFCNGLVSYGLITVLSGRLGLRVMWAKIMAESLLFIASFTIQRDFIFTKRSSHSVPDEGEPGTEPSLAIEGANK